MTDPHAMLRRLLAGKGHANGDFHWHHVLSLINQVRANRSDEAEQVLAEIAEFEGHLVFDGRHGHPHALPPSDLLRTLAVQTLAAWDARKHQATIQRAADVAQTHPARAIARALLA